MTANTSVKINAAMSVVTILTVVFLNFGLSRSAVKNDTINKRLDEVPTFTYVNGQDEKLKQYTDDRDKDLNAKIDQNKSDNDEMHKRDLMEVNKKLDILLTFVKTR